MTPEERIEAAVGKAQVLWAFVMGICVLVVLVFLPWWNVLFLIPVGMITYFGAITAIAVYLTASFRNEEEHELQKLRELQAKLSTGDLQASELMRLLGGGALKDVAPVSAMSEPIGTLNDQLIFEWIELFDPRTNKLERFFFYGPAQSETGVPDEPGKYYANVNGVLYLSDPKCGSTSSKS